MPVIAAYNAQQSQFRAFNFLTNTAAAADAACVQEAGMQMNARGEIEGLLDCHTAAAYINDPCMLITHTLQRAAGSGRIDIGAGLNGNRPALVVRLRSGLVVANVHLTSGNPGRSVPELAAVRTYLEENFGGAQWIIIGDFNHDPSGQHADLHIARGPQHQNGDYLDWAISNVAGIATGAYPRYGGSDHGPWFVNVPG